MGRWTARRFDRPRFGGSRWSERRFGCNGAPGGGEVVEAAPPAEDIDTAEKRRAVAGVPFPPLGPGVTPNAAKDAEWRRQAAGSYTPQ